METGIGGKWKGTLLLETCPARGIFCHDTLILTLWFFYFFGYANMVSTTSMGHSVYVFITILYITGARKLMRFAFFFLEFLWPQICFISMWIWVTNFYFAFFEFLGHFSSFLGHIFLFSVIFTDFPLDYF